MNFNLDQIKQIYELGKSDSQDVDNIEVEVNNLNKLLESFGYAPDLTEIMTKDRFERILPGMNFCDGYAKNEPEGIYMTNSDIGRELFWVAKKGYGNDWCIYICWKGEGYAHCVNNGDKVINEANIRKLIPCTDEVFKLYRY